MFVLLLAIVREETCKFCFFNLSRLISIDFALCIKCIRFLFHLTMQPILYRAEVIRRANGVNFPEEVVTFSPSLMMISLCFILNFNIVC